MRSKLPDLVDPPRDADAAGDQLANGQEQHEQHGAQQHDSQQLQQHLQQPKQAAGFNDIDDDELLELQAEVPEVRSRATGRGRQGGPRGVVLAQKMPVHKEAAAVIVLSGTR